MARPRSPETDEIIRLLGTKMTVRAVAAQLGLGEDVVKNAYYKHYDEVMALQKQGERYEKAQEIKAQMDAAKVGKGGRKPKPVNEQSESVSKPGGNENETPKSVSKPGETMNGALEGVVEVVSARNVLIKEPTVQLPEGARELIHSEPAVPEEPEAVAEEAIKQAERKPEPPSDAAQTWIGTSMAAGAQELGERVRAKARELFGEAKAAAFPKRMKVAGYVGQGGRTYMLRDQGVQILGLTTRTDFTTAEIRELSDDLIELLSILDGEVIGA